MRLRKSSRKRSRQPRGPGRQTRYTRALGILFCLAGFAAIFLGWAGAARQACVDCQLPYLLSGGALGLGLIVFGAVLMIMAQLRTDTLRLLERLDAGKPPPPNPGEPPEIPLAPGAPGAPERTVVVPDGTETEPKSLASAPA